MELDEARVEGLRVVRRAGLCRCGEARWRSCLPALQCGELRPAASSLRTLVAVAFLAGGNARVVWLARTGRRSRGSAEGVRSEFAKVALGGRFAWVGNSPDRWKKSLVADSWRTMQSCLTRIGQRCVLDVRGGVGKPLKKQFFDANALCY